MLNFLMIKLARKDSSKLNGTAKTNILVGNTLKFHATTHINTNPTNQERRVV
jgi:hypothetical protein